MSSKIPRGIRLDEAPSAECKFSWADLCSNITHSRARRLKDAGLVVKIRPGRWKMTEDFWRAVSDRPDLNTQQTSVGDVSLSEFGGGVSDQEKTDSRHSNPGGSGPRMGTHTPQKTQTKTQSTLSGDSAGLLQGDRLPQHVLAGLSTSDPGLSDERELEDSQQTLTEY